MSGRITACFKLPCRLTLVGAMPPCNAMYSPSAGLHLSYLPSASVTAFSVRAKGVVPSRFLGLRFPWSSLGSCRQAAARVLKNLTLAVALSLQVPCKRPCKCDSRGSAEARDISEVGLPVPLGRTPLGGTAPRLNKLTNAACDRYVTSAMCSRTLQGVRCEDTPSLSPLCCATLLLPASTDQAGNAGMPRMPRAETQGGMPMHPNACVCRSRGFTGFTGFAQPGSSDAVLLLLPWDTSTDSLDRPFVELFTPMNHR